MIPYHLTRLSNKDYSTYMATDYDAPRRLADDDPDADSLEGLRSQEKQSDEMDDNGDEVETFDIPTQDVTREEIDVAVVPKRSDEFTCGSCFIVQSRKRLSHEEPDGTLICMDCA